MNTISSKFLLIIGVFISLFLFILTQFESYFDLELIFAPVVVVTLLNYSDQIMIHVLRFVLKVWNRVL